VAKRNRVLEWTRAQGRRGAGNLDAWTPLTPRPRAAEPPVAPGELPAWLRRTRRVTTAPRISEQGAEAIRVLQNANRLLQRRFGIDWADAASVIFEESGRRGASPILLARVLAAGLRRDERGKTK
jgi:hypothetical protein